jgi:hypothetical protein
MELKYGILKNEQIASVLSIPMGASEVIPAGGCFVKSDGSGRAETAGDGSTLLAGYVFPTELDSGKKYQTCSATEGGTVVPFIPISAMLGVVVRLANAGGTYAATMVLKTGDLEINSTTKEQGVQLDASSEDTVIIVGGDVAGTYVDVTVNPDKIASLTGVV